MGIAKPTPRPQVRLCIPHLGEYALRASEVTERVKIIVSEGHECAACRVVVS